MRRDDEPIPSHEANLEMPKRYAQIAQIDLETSAKKASPACWSWSYGSWGSPLLKNEGYYFIEISRLILPIFHQFKSDYQNVYVIITSYCTEGTYIRNFLRYFILI